MWLKLVAGDAAHSPAGFSYLGIRCTSYVDHLVSG